MHAIVEAHHVISHKIFSLCFHWVFTTATVVAFFTGVSSSLPGIRWFCWYAGPTVAIDFFYQITLFIAILVYDERRVKANRYDCLVCVKATHQEDNEKELDESRHRTVPVQYISSDKPDSSEKTMSRYADLLLQPVVKLSVLIIFTVMFALGVWGALMQNQEFDFRTLTPTDSYIRTVWTSSVDAFNNFSRSC